MKKIFYISIALLLGLSLSSCEDKLGFDPDAEAISISGTEYNPVVKMAVDDVLPVEYTFSVNCTGKVSNEVTCKVAIDPDSVPAYNAANKTNYFCVPEGAAVIENDEVKIEPGKASSNPVKVSLVSLDGFDAGRTYVIPVSVVSVSGTDAKILDAEKTIFIKIARTLTLGSINMDNSNFSSCYFFPEELAKILENYTIEIKIYPTRWNGMSPSLSRLWAVKTALADKSNYTEFLYRFGEVEAEDRLQIICPPGNKIVPDDAYELNKWTMITLTYDGASTAVFNDGVKVVDVANGNGKCSFGGIELGMSWAGYPSKQLYHGRATEMRIWERALSSSEIKGGLCGVPADSEGLLAYWRFDEASGSIFKDATGHGYDMDWSKSVRELDESSGTYTVQNKAQYVNRVRDSKNKCAN